jgi:hypothetical protein
MHRGTADVGVEVDVHIRRTRPCLTYPAHPTRQGPLAITEPAARPRVQAQVAPIGTPPQRSHRPRAPVGPAQRRAVVLRDSAHLRAPPGNVPRFNCDPPSWREASQAARESGRGGSERRRQLEQDRAESTAKTRSCRQEPVDRLLRVAQAADIGQIPAGPDRHDAIRRTAPASATSRRRRRLTSTVAKAAAYVSSHRRSRGEREDPGIMVVLPARGVDQNRHRSRSFVSRDSRFQPP